MNTNYRFAVSIPTANKKGQLYQTEIAVCEIKPISENQIPVFVHAISKEEIATGIKRPYEVEYKNLEGISRPQFPTDYQTTKYTGITEVSIFKSKKEAIAWKINAVKIVLAEVHSQMEAVITRYESKKKQITKKLSMVSTRMPELFL